MRGRSTVRIAIFLDENEQKRKRYRARQPLKSNRDVIEDVVFSNMRDCQERWTKLKSARIGATSGLELDLFTQGRRSQQRFNRPR